MSNLDLKDPHVFRLVHKHDATMPGTHGFWITEDTVMRDAIGRSNGQTYAWLDTRCWAGVHDDYGWHDCPARALVRQDAITKLVNDFVGGAK